MFIVVIFIVLGLASSCLGAGCPYGGNRRSILSKDGQIAEYTAKPVAVETDFDAVMADLEVLLTDSQDFWPADFGNYGGLFIRLAWHCSGSYRRSDGRGGCDGGRIRFNPEYSWPDNANLDMALKLLEPIKLKYGKSLSWGDLIVLSGTVAIKSLGGPVLGFCGGRVDDDDGFDSLELGPTDEQQEVAPCEENGFCTFPLGPTTVGLIYVNPEGPGGKGDPKGSSVDIRKSFGNMGFNDTEAVALIGGGHSFGKCHGACPTPPCGKGEMKGRGNNTFTSGIEGPWTLRPTEWTNLYFSNLLDLDWVEIIGPGGARQWAPRNREDGSEGPPVIMLTSDIAFLEDKFYLELTKKFAANITVLEEQFSAAWYRLTSQDMGPATRCVGNDVPPPQPFQDTLPAGPARKDLPDFKEVRAAIKEVLYGNKSSETADVVGKRRYYGALFSTLAFQCASTFRATDFKGGCNGARIRFSPYKERPENEDLGPVLDVLEPILEQFDNLSFADLIVLAGYVAHEEAGGKMLPFCGGRVDAEDGGNVEIPERFYMTPVIANRDTMKVMGLTAHEFVALMGRLRSPMHEMNCGISGWYGEDPSEFSNAYFITLLSETWVYVGGEYQAQGNKNVVIRATDQALLEDPVFLAIVQEYAASEDHFMEHFAVAWTKLMNADRFDGPTGNVCSSLYT